MFTRLLFAALIIAGIVLLMRRLRGSPKTAASDGRRMPAMSRSEALQVLGLPEDASQEDVQKAHRRLLQKLHPDHGGSDYLAQRINAARDRLSDP